MASPGIKPLNPLPHFCHPALQGPASCLLLGQNQSFLPEGRADAVRLSRGSIRACPTTGQGATQTGSPTLPPSGFQDTHKIIPYEEACDVSKDRILKGPQEPQGTEKTFPIVQIKKLL